MNDFCLRKIHLKYRRNIAHFVPSLMCQLFNSPAYYCLQKLIKIPQGTLKYAFSKASSRLMLLLPQINAEYPNHASSILLKLLNRMIGSRNPTRFKSVWEMEVKYLTVSSLNEVTTRHVQALENPAYSLWIGMTDCGSSPLFFSMWWRTWWVCWITLILDMIQYAEFERDVKEINRVEIILKAERDQRTGQIGVVTSTRGRTAVWIFAHKSVLNSNLWKAGLVHMFL